MPGCANRCSADADQARFLPTICHLGSGSAPAHASRMRGTRRKFLGAAALTATAAGLTVVPHMSGGGLGYVEVIQFASFTPNIGAHMEFKGNTALPVRATDSTLRCTDGRVRCPAGVGFGMTFDPDYIAKGTPVKL